MKVTSFEISKKLAEIGFKAETDFRYVKCNNGCELFHASEDSVTWEVGVNAFCLETIIDALPKKIEMGGDTKELILNIAISELSYTTEDHCYYIMSPDGTYPDWLPKDIIVFRNKDESLADTAARLLIKLYEAGLVRFEQLTNKEE